MHKLNGAVKVELVWQLYAGMQVEAVQHVCLAVHQKLLLICSVSFSAEWDSRLCTPSEHAQCFLAAAVLLMYMLQQPFEQELTSLYHFLTHDKGCAGRWKPKSMLRSIFLLMLWSSI